MNHGYAYDICCIIYGFCNDVSASVSVCLPTHQGY